MNNAANTAETTTTVAALQGNETIRFADGKVVTLSRACRPDWTDFDVPVRSLVWDDSFVEGVEPYPCDHYIALDEIVTVIG